MKSKLELSSAFSCRSLLIALIIVLIASVTSLAQSAAARPDRGIMPVGSYSVSDVETVNTTNGNVHISVPLAKLPAMAGGRLAAAISATYDSKVWDARTEERQQRVMEPIYTARIPQLSENGGWKIGGMYNITGHLANDDYNAIPIDGDPDFSHSWSKVILSTPDGATHELRPLDYAPYSGNHEYFIGFYQDSPNSTGSAMRYYSFDGSFLWAKLYPYTSSTSWELYLPDGTKVVQLSSGIQRITDTNGNSIKIYTDAENGLTTTHYQDEQTGREIKIAYNPSGNNNQGSLQVLYQTVGGGWTTIDINFGTTTVSGKTYKIQGPYCSFNESLWAQMQVIREIILPQTEPGVQRQKFTFTYNSDTTDSRAVYWQPAYSCGDVQLLTNSPSHGMGSLSQMTMPGGAVVNYSHTLDGIEDTDLDGDGLAAETLSAKTIVHDGNTDQWSYSIGFNGGSVTSPDSSVTTESFYFHSPAYGFILGGSNGLAGLVYRTNQSNKVLLERHWIRMKFDGAYENAPGALLVFNPVVDAEYTSLLDDSPSHNPTKMSAKSFQYDYNGNLLTETDYDWFDPNLVSRDGNGIPTGVPGSATVLRVINNSYYNPASASSSGNVYAKRSVSTATPLILNALQQGIVGPLTTQLSYDSQPYGYAPTAGNLTSKSVWDDVDTKWITTSQTYDLYGNLASSTDGNQKVTQFTYDDPRFGLPNHVIVDPQNGGGTQTTTTYYDPSTGLVTQTVDPNNQITNIYYTNQLLGTTVDPFGRPGIVISPLVNAGGVNQHHRTTTYYEDHLLRVTIAADLNSENDKLLKTRNTSDMLGRTILTERTEDGTNYTIYSRKAYDQMGKITYASAPMRYGISASTDSWMRVTNDVLGRPIEVATFGGPAQPAATGTGGIWTGSVTTSYYANSVTVIDQAAKQRQSVSDALGRLVQVYEAPNDANFNYLTTYDYDVFGNLRHVYQGTQPSRTFSYDSLSRLRSANNPESGTVSYSYDDDGNLTSKTDARSITTSYVYDALNRVTNRNYSDGTPAVTYTYDTLGQNGKGRLTSVSSSVSAYSYGGYDADGKLLSATQTIYGATNQSYTVTYNTYDLAGHVITMTYPSGRQVTNSYDNAARLQSFSGNLGGAQKTYASGIIYDAASRMTKEQFGTTTAIFNKLFYNSRGQLSEIREGTSYTSSSDTGFELGAIINHYSDSCWGMCYNLTTNTGSSMSDNNANLKTQQHWIKDGNGNVQAIFQQQYDYDSLNRLQKVSDDRNNPSWRQQYGYDQWGNRTIVENNNTGVATWNFGVDTSKNRLTAPSPWTMGYDAAGNLNFDNYTGQGERRYDAQNRMTQAQGGGNSSWQYYSYDGDGRRVKRNVTVSGQSPVETWQVYGVGGELLAEYAANANPTTTPPQKEYGYRNGQLLIIATVNAGGWGPPPSYTGPNPLLTGHDIKLENLTELRTAVNALRQHAGLQPFSFTVDPNPVRNETTVKAEHIRQLRTALEQARTALGLPVGGYEHPTLTENVSGIYAKDFQELRDQINSAWQGGGSSVDIRWLVADQLGTPRIIFDQTGALATTSRHDYLPFGEELFAGTGGRTTAQGYPTAPNPSESVRQHFTLKERDNETGLDYFLARYYSSTQGRFTSTDEFAGGPDALYTFADDASANPTFYADLTNPQSLNKYQYTYNDPLNFTDSDGHCPICAAAAVGIAVGVYILLSPQTVQAPGLNDSRPRETSRSSAEQIVALGAAEAIGGPILSKLGGALWSRLGARGGAAAERAALQAERQNIARLVHMRELGLDPAIKGFRAAEGQAGLRLEAQIGRRLTRESSGALDFVDKTGRTYELVGAGLRSAHFNFEGVSREIVSHLDKADRVVVDVSRLTGRQARQIQDFVAGIESEQARRIIILH